MALNGRTIGPSPEIGDVAVHTVASLDYQVGKLAFGDADTATPVDEANPLPVRSTPAPFTPLGYQQITGLSTMKTLTVPDGATLAVIDAETQGVRWRDDGTSPTTSVGKRILVDTELVYDGDLSAIRFIEMTASAKLNVVYYA